MMIEINRQMITSQNENTGKNIIAIILALRPNSTTEEPPVKFELNRFIKNGFSIV